MKVKKVIVHNSASDHPNDDSLEAITNLHISPKFMKFKWGNYDTHGKGFKAVGYHYIIIKDGLEIGRQINEQGAHCFGENFDSLGICVTGERFFSEKQMSLLEKLLINILIAHNLTPDDIYPHSYFNKKKTCPNFDLDKIINNIRSIL